MNLFELFVKIGVDDQASDKIASLTSKLGSGLATAAKVGTATVGAVTAATGALYTGITAAAGSVAAYGDNIDKMSQKMGMSAEAYQEWDAVMQHSGTSIESLRSGMRTLANAVESGNNAFERLGISQEEIAKMSNEELFSATITALQNVENETERTYLAGQLLGRGSMELGALLNTSAEDTQAMKDRVHELGGVMSDEAIKAAARYQDSLQDMQTSFSGLKNNLIADFLPGMATIMDGIASMMVGEDGAQALLSDGISQMIETMGGAIPNFFSAADQIIGAVSDAITDNLPSMVDGGLDILLNIVDGFADNIDKIIPAVVDTILTIVDTLTNPDSISKLIGAAVKIIGAVASGLIEATPQLVMKIPEIIASIVDGFLDAMPDIISVGEDIVRGIWEGISNLGSWLGDKVGGFFGDMVDGVKDFLGIHSPSRVFATIGEFMMEGLAIGMENSKGKVMETAADIVSEVKDRFSGLVDVLTGHQDVEDLEYQLWERTVGKNATDAEKYEKQLEMLTSQQKDQESVVEAAAAAYEAIVAQYGESSAESYSYQKTLYQEMLAYQDLIDQIQEVISAKEALGRLNTASVSFEDSIAAVASAGIVNGINISNQSTVSVPNAIDLTMKSEDGQTFGRWMVPFVRSENRSNPEVVSDI